MPTLTRLAFASLLASTLASCPETYAYPVTCNNACDAGTSHCNVNTGYCVECLESAHCTDPARPACSSAGVCVECATAGQCASIDTPACLNGSCSACTADAQCSRFASTPVCDATEGRCTTECTDDADCAGKSCAALDRVCTTTDVVSVRTCEPCRTDSECVADHRCVPMYYQTALRPQAYCLKLQSTGCARPYGTSITRGSLSDPDTPLQHCGIHEGTTTCEAVLDLIAATTCTPETAGEDCGDPLLADDGRCETVGAFSNQCTYSCGGVDQCPVAVDCNVYCGAPL